MPAPRLLVALAALVAASSPRLAGAEQEDTRSRDRVIFYAALAVTGAGLATWMFAGTRVVAAERDIDRIGPEIPPVPGDMDGQHEDVCAAAEESTGPAADQALSICRRGERWATVANVSQVVTLGSAVVTAVFAYRAFRSPASDQKPVAPPRSAWRAQPIATPTAVGLGVDVQF